MKYTVRSPEGDLTFQSFGELERAFWSGLVDPEDKVQEEGSEGWRRADSIPVLRRPRPLTGQEKQAQRLWLGLAVFLGSVGLWALSGPGASGPDRYVRYGIALGAAALLVPVLGRLTRSAHSRKPSGRTPGK